MSQRFTYSIPTHALPFPATADRICVAEPRPHTYGVRHLPCNPLATEPCRPTVCDPCGYPRLTARYSLFPAHSTDATPARPAHPILHSSFFILNWTYTFSAKERDSETGLSYFGSRYYSSDLSIWLSVDPMSDKYPSLSPYVYCADNPVKLVDPNGEEVTSPDGWIVNNTNKTLIWVNNMGGDMCQYVGGVVTSFKSRSDFINEYASNGYQIIIEDNTKPGLSTGTSLSQDSPSSTSDYSKSLWEQHLAHTVPLLVDSLVVLSLDFGDLKWALNLESTSIIRSIRNDFLH